MPADQGLAQRLAPPQQPRLDRPLGDAEDPGGFLDLVPLHVDEEDRLAIAGIDLREPLVEETCPLLGLQPGFLGRLEGTRFEGTYTTRGTAREYQSGGRWSAQRK